MSPRLSIGCGAYSECQHHSQNRVLQKVSHILYLSVPQFLADTPTAGLLVDQVKLIDLVHETIIVLR